MYYYDPVKNALVLYPYNRENKSQCVRKDWNEALNQYVCTKYRCNQCYDCDEATGRCKDTLISKAACKAKKSLGKKVPECNYESFTTNYIGDTSVYERSI